MRISEHLTVRTPNVALMVNTLTLTIHDDLEACDSTFKNWPSFGS